MALGLAVAGATVIAVARDARELAETERLAVELPGSITGIPCDVADPAEVSLLGDAVRERHGPPTILVNAAGVFGPIALIRDVDAALGAHHRGRRHRAVPDGARLPGADARRRAGGASST